MKNAIFVIIVLTNGVQHARCASIALQTITSIVRTVESVLRKRADVLTVGAASAAAKSVLMSVMIFA